MRNVPKVQHTPSRLVGPAHKPTLTKDITITAHHHHHYHLMREITMGDSPALSHTQPPSSLPPVLVMPPTLVMIIITDHH